MLKTIVLLMAGLMRGSKATARPQAQKKLHPPLGMVELLGKQIQTLTSHCNLFQWLKKMFTLLRLRLSVYQSEIREDQPSHDGH